MSEGPHISIKPEVISYFGSLPITNSFLVSLIALVVLTIVAIYYRLQLNSANKSKFFYLLQFLLTSLYNFFESMLGKRIAGVFTYLSGLFIYILFVNWFILLPGVGSILIQIQEGGQQVMAPLLRGNTTDLNTTFAFAIMSFVIIQYYGFKELGFAYLGKFFNFSNPLKFFIGILELVSELSRIISFSFRLFGNIFAGEIIIAVIAFLIPVLASFPFLLLEIFVGFIQALVFAMLTAVFINLAASHHQEA